MSIFRFKKFNVSHSLSSMKVGIDGVLIGAWGEVKGKRGIDIGCGCGLLALIAAQRNPSSAIEAIDIHDGSVKESSVNFSLSPWKENLFCYKADVSQEDFLNSHMALYDFILSNPPFFAAGMKAPHTAREQARHQDSLSPFTLINFSDKILKYGGSLSFIFPSEFKERVITEALNQSLFPSRICDVADRPGKEPKRTMVTLKKINPSEVKCIPQLLYIRDEFGNYSNEYKNLTKDFYLNLE